MCPATLSPELLPEGLDDLGLSTPSFDGIAPPDSFGLCKLMNLGIALVQMNSRKRQEVVFCSLLWELGVVKALESKIPGFKSQLCHWLWWLGQMHSFSSSVVLPLKWVNSGSSSGSSVVVVGTSVQLFSLLI